MKNENILKHRINPPHIKLKNGFEIDIPIRYPLKTLIMNSDEVKNKKQYGYLPDEFLKNHAIKEIEYGLLRKNQKISSIERAWGLFNPEQDTIVILKDNLKRLCEESAIFLNEENNKTWYEIWFSIIFYHELFHSSYRFWIEGNNEVQEFKEVPESLANFFSYLICGAIYDQRLVHKMLSYKALRQPKPYKYFPLMILYDKGYIEDHIQYIKKIWQLLTKRKYEELIVYFYSNIVGMYNKLIIKPGARINARNVDIQIPFFYNGGFNLVFTGMLRYIVGWEEGLLIGDNIQIIDGYIKHTDNTFIITNNVFEFWTYDDKVKPKNIFIIPKQEIDIQKSVDSNNNLVNNRDNIYRDLLLKNMGKDKNLSNEDVIKILRKYIN